MQPQPRPVPLFPAPQKSSQSRIEGKLYGHPPLPVAYPVNRQQAPAQPPPQKIATELLFPAVTPLSFLRSTHPAFPPQPMQQPESAPLPIARRAPR